MEDTIANHSGLPLKISFAQQMKSTPKLHLLLSSLPPLVFFQCAKATAFVGTFIRGSDQAFPNK